MPLVHGGYLECGPINGQPACRMEWTYEVVEPVKPQVPKPPPRELLESEQIWQAVQEYFRSKGTGVPPAEAKACLAAIKEEREALKNPVAAVQLEVVPVVELPPRPEYGTPAKAAREKAKAEKEAAKEAKAKAKAEAKAAKENAKQKKKST